MSAPDQSPPPDFDEEFLEAIKQWRERNKVSSDDVVLLLLDLFRIHQNHWDALRRRQMPSLDMFRTDIGLMGAAVKTFKEQTTALIEALKQTPAVTQARTISLDTAIIAVIAAMLAGFLIGKAL